MGYPVEANEMQFENLERSGTIAFDRGHYLKWIWQTLLKYVTGEGIGSGYFIPFIYAGVMVLLVKTLMMRRWGQHEKLTDLEDKPIKKIYHHIDEFFYSIDMLLPIITLREKHSEIDLSGCIRYFLDGHRLPGGPDVVAGEPLQGGAAGSVHLGLDIGNTNLCVSSQFHRLSNTCKNL